MKKLLFLAAVAIPGCLNLNEDHDIYMTDKALPTPNVEMLDYWRRPEPQRSDPTWVACWELQLVKDIPFSGEAFGASIFAFHASHPKHPEWGNYVARWYVDRSGRSWR